MSIYKRSINRPITTLLIFVAVIILGLFSLLKLPIDLFPEIEPPYVSIITTYSGANGSEIETNVTKLLENSLNSVDGLNEITSSSKDNMSLVTLEFEWGHNIDEAVNDIRSAIDMVYDYLPDGCSKPLIFKFNSNMMPIMSYAFTAKESYAGLEKILEDNVVNVLNKIDGIGNISLSGAPKRYVYIDLDPNKVNAYNLTLEQVGQAVSSNNLNLASGSVKMGKEQYQLRVQSEYIESSEIGDIVVSTSMMGVPVYLRDIATVRDTIKDIALEEKINGIDGVRLIILKQSNANTVDICEKVHLEMAKIKKNLPKDIDINLIFESADDIRGAVNGLSEAIMYALIFVVLVILFFLGRWRATIIIALTIPISLIVAFIYLLFTDSSLNIISLSALSVAIGMVVDDAIVVLENITRHIDRGANPRDASIYATNEVWIAVITTTLVIVVVFVPLTMLGGMAGTMFKELGWIVTIVICTSTLVAISLTPMLSSKLLKSKKIIINKDGYVEDVENRDGWYQKNIVTFLDKIDKFYANVLRKCLDHKKKTIFIAFAIFIISLLPFVLGGIGTDFIPMQDNGRLNVSIELQRGTRIEEAIASARKIENRIVALVPELRLISTSTGADDEAGFAALFGNASNNKISIIIKTTKKNERNRSIVDIAEVLRKEFDKIPEIITYQVSNYSGMAFGGGSTVDIEVFGYDFDKTNKVVNDIKLMVKNIKGARDIKVSREEDRAELKIVCDKTKLALHGLNSATVARYVRNRVYGMNAGFLKEDGKEYDIVVRVAEEYRNTITDIEELTIMTPRGKLLKLKEIATIKEYWNPPNIERQARQRVVKVSVTPVDISLGELANVIEKDIKKINIPQDIRINIGGNYEEQQKTFADLGVLFLLIVLLVYIVMASQFESYAKPFIIMMSVPFAFSGAILALWITNCDLDMIGALGVVLLVGIVVKNGIVLVDYINLMRDRGYELKEAIALSGQSRLRPVLMTAVTTILGMIPMALSTSEGSEIWVPMGIVVIGGLTVSTFVTLIIVPVLYAVMSRKGERDKTKKVREKFIFMDLSDK